MPTPPAERPTVHAYVASIRVALRAARGSEAWYRLAPQIGISRASLERFAAGGSVGTATLEKIDQWIRTEERQHGHHHQ